jgi:magnesium transporter
MINKKTNKTITWVDVENPTTEEIRHLMEEYDISPNIAKELQLPTYKEKIVFNKNYFYTVLHFPAFRHSHSNDTVQEVDFIVGKNFIITTRYESIDALERFTKKFEVNSILDKGVMEDNAGYVFYYIIKELYKSMSDELDSINDKMKFIEKTIFKGREKEMLLNISKVNHDLINLNHIINSHKDIIESLEKNGSEVFDEDFSNNFSKILNEYYRIKNNLNSNIDFIREIRDTNDSLLSSKQNEIMKTLTVITFLALPFTVFTGFFQMNTLNTPIVGNVNDWQIIVISEILVMLVLAIFAKYKKWF